MPDSLASAVDIAFSRNAVAASPLAEPAKLQPILSAAQLFGSPLRTSQIQISQPHVRFKDAKRDSGFSSGSPSQLQSDHRKIIVVPAASATPAFSPAALKFQNAVPPIAPGSVDTSNPSQIVTGVWSKRGAISVVSGSKRRAGQAF